MEIIKVLNNSSAIVSHDKKKLFVTGKGLTFGKKKGDKIKQDDILEMFYLNTSKTQQHIATFRDISDDYYIVTKEIVKLIEEDFLISDRDSLYLSLLDHIYFAIDRYKNKIQLSNALLSEIKFLYSKEYKTGMKALKLINFKFRVLLKEDEAGFIAMHIVNTTQNIIGNQTNELLNETVLDIANIIESYYQLNLKSSVHYSRLITHLKYLCLRLIDDNMELETATNVLNDIQLSHSESWLIKDPVNDYLQERFKKSLSENELIYLVLHINRLLDNN